MSPWNSPNNPGCCQENGLLITTIQWNPVAEYNIHKTHRKVNLVPTQSLHHNFLVSLVPLVPEETLQVTQREM